MTNVFLPECDNIYRLKVPFENLYTSVFLIITEEKRILIDCATTDYDVDNHIIPAINQMGYAIDEIDTIVLTHRHGDHAGGLKRLLYFAPGIEVITRECVLDEQISTYPLPGHTPDCIGILDGRTHTLISGDGLQGAGVDKYRCSVADKSLYLETIEKIRKDESIENVLFSHAYEPWYQDGIFGRQKVLDCLNECKNYI